MTATTIANLPLTTRFNTGTFKTALRSVPVGFQNVVLTLSPTTGNAATPFLGIANPFNSPAESMTFGLMYSWDGGLTFPDSVERTVTGSASGQWQDAKGHNTMTPAAQLALVWDSAAAGIPPCDPSLGPCDSAGFPTSYIAYATTVVGPINSGLLVVENTIP